MTVESWSDLITLSSSRTKAWTRSILSHKARSVHTKQITELIQLRNKQQQLHSLRWFIHLEKI